MELRDGLSVATANEAVDAAARRSRRYLVAISLGYVALLALVLSRSWFVSDDLLNFGLTRDNGLTESFLRSGIFGHFAPVHHVLDWIVVRFFPLEWAAPAVMLSVMLLVTLWVLHAVVRILAPTESWPTLLLAPFAASPLVLSTAIWWAAAAHSIPAMLLGSVATLAAVRYDARPRWPDALVYTASLAVSLLCYEKAALVPIGILALLWARPPDGSQLRDLVAVLRRCRLLVGVTAVLVVAFAVVLRSGHYDSGVPKPSASTWWEWLVRLVSAGPFVGSVGVSPDVYESVARTVLLVVGGGAIVAGVAWSIARFRGAWRAWVYLIVAFVPGVALTAYGRAESFGPGVASDFHYSPELAPVVVIAITLACTRTRRRSPEEHRSRRPDRMVALLLVPVVVLSIVSTFRAAADFSGASTRRFFANLERSSRDYAGGPASRYSVVNTDAPARIVPGVFEPYNQIAHLLDLSPRTRALRTDLAPGSDLLLVGPDGTIGPARLQVIGQSVATSGSCLSPSSFGIPPNPDGTGDPTTLFVVIDGSPTPPAAQVTTRASGATRTQPMQGSLDGRPVRLWASGQGLLRFVPWPGACLTRFAVLRAVPARRGSTGGQPSP
jgi:hypothetical protein